MSGTAAAIAAPSAVKLRAGLIEILATGLIVGILALPIAGFRISDAAGGASLDLRLGSVVIAAVVAALGRLALVLIRERVQVLPVAVACLAAAVLIALQELLGWRLPGIEVKLPFASGVLNWIIAAISTILALRGIRQLSHREVTPEERDKRMDLVGARVQRLALWLGPVILLFAILLPFMPFADRRLVDIATLVMTYVMLGWGLNIVVGLAGLLDLGYVAFYAVGAYSFALLANHFDWGFWTALPLAGVFSASFGVMLGFPVLRLRGDYLAIVTLGFGEMVRVILLNWYSVTKGPDGLSGIPRPTLFGLEFKRRAAEGVDTFSTFFNVEYSSLQRVVFLYYVILAMAMLTNLFTMRIRKLPIGRSWEALREDEIACRSLGINPTNTKLTAFGIGAMFAGFAGSFFATRQGFISPESFTFIESAVILAIVVLGGMGSQLGVVVAAILLIGAPEFFRELQEYRMLAFGAGMVLIMLWRPRGLLAHREPTLRLFGRKVGYFSNAPAAAGEAAQGAQK